MTTWLGPFHITSLDDNQARLMHLDDDITFLTLTFTDLGPDQRDALLVLHRRQIHVAVLATEEGDITIAPWRPLHHGATYPIQIDPAEWQKLLDIINKE